MKEKFKFVLMFLVFTFIVFGMFYSRYSELTFIYHSYLFALIILSIFVIFTIWIITTNHTINKETFNPVVWIPLIALILLIFTSIVKYDSVVETYRVVSPVFLFLVMVNILRTKKDWKIVVYSLLGAGLLFTFYNYIGFYFGPGFGTSALASNWGYQNTFAAFLVLMIQISLGVYFEESNRKIKMVLSILPMFFIFVLFLTVSRGGYIAFAVSIIAFLIASPRKSISKSLKEFAPIVIGAMALILFGSPKEIILANLGKSSVLMNFIGGEENYSLGMRVYLAKLAFQIFLKKPVFGFGLGTFRYTFTLYNTQDLFFRIDPHSLFFKFLAETGIIGTIAFFTFPAYYLIKALVNSRKGNENFIYTGIFAGTTGMFFHMCIDVDIYPIMFVLLFLGISLITRKESEYKIKPKLILTAVTVALLAVISISLLPKTIAASYAVKGENPGSLTKVTESIELFKKAINSDPQSHTYHFLLGEMTSKSMISYNDNLKIQQTLESYKKAYELNKYDYRAPLRIGIASLFDRSTQSITYLEAAKELYPKNPNILSWLSVAYAYIYKDIDKAKMYLDEAQKNSKVLELDLTFANGVLELAKGNFTAADKYFSTLSFYDEIYKKLDILPKNYAAGRYALQLKIIRDLMSEFKEKPPQPAL